MTTTDGGAAPSWSLLTPDQKLAGTLEDVFGATERPRRGLSTGQDEAVVTPVSPVTPPTTPLGHRGLHDYLEGCADILRRYVAFGSEHQPVAIALWVAMAWLIERFDIAPILAITSAEKQSGKTRTLDVLELLVPWPQRMVLPSEAVLYTILSQDPRPTLLLDEADTIFGARSGDRYEGLRAILNSGHRRGSPVPRVRWDGKRREIERFDVFGPKVVAGIGELPDTVADRSIPIRLRRRRPDETVGRFRQRDATALAGLIRFPDEVELLQVDPDIPEELPDRAADGWEPLILIADTAGGIWPYAARAAALTLSTIKAVPLSTGIRLLRDIKDAFGHERHLPTEDLLRWLHEVEDGPWGEWYGKPMSPTALAKLLAPYGIAPRQERVGGTRSRGYFAADFEDAWERYVPSVAGETAGTAGTAGTSAANHDPASADADDAEQGL